MECIGIRFKNIRKILKKSQDELAIELGVTKQAISNIENAKSMPGLTLLNKLLTSYDVNLNYLVAGIGDIFTEKEKTYKTLRNTLIKEVEELLDSRGIN